MLLVSRIVDEDVEFAELGNRFFHYPPRELRFLKIAVDEVHLPALSFNRLCRFERIAFFLRQICKRYISAFSGKQHSHCSANAGVATSDESHLVFEFSRSFVVWRFITRTRRYLRLQAGLSLMLLRHRRLRLF
jgi:hypothetical protein